MPTFGYLSKTITDIYDEIEESHFVPIHDFISDVVLASKKKETSASF